MRKSLISRLILFTTMTSALLMSSGSALAACAYTEWTNVQPGHPLPTITARLCGEALEVNVIGSDPQGNTFDFGWSEAVRVSENSYTSAFVDANASNSILVEIDPEANTMRLTIDTQLAGDSNVTQWFADYTLGREYD